MVMMRSALLAVAGSTVAFAAGLTSDSLTSFVDSLDLGFSFNPVKPAYWTSLPHHRRTPFSVSPDGTTAYLAYLDSSLTDVHVVEVDTTTFAAKGTPVTVTGGKEAGGLVAQNDGFALLTNVAVTGTDAPPDSTPVPVIVRYTNGEESWRTFVAGPGVHAADGLSAAPDMNGDLVYSEAAGLYGAYFVVTDYTGAASGHFGDSIQYVKTDGTLETITGASSSWGCSHNTGIAFEAADAAPFASICAEDQGAIWLNTETQGMGNNGIKLSNENTTNGASGEPMGGMSGSYSSLAKFVDNTKYIFAWATRGAVDLTENTWMGDGYTQCSPRQMSHNVAISIMSDKQTLVGDQAISTVGAAVGDAQLNLVTDSSTIDHINVHAATFDGSNALVSWEQIDSPTCELAAFGCSGTFSGSYFQLVDSTGAKVGEPISSNDIYVAGDIVNIGDKLCFPYVSMTWDLTTAIADEASGATYSKMSFGCVANGASSSSSATTTAASSSSAAAAAATTASSASSVAAAATSSAANVVAPVVDSTSAVAAVTAPTTTDANGSPTPSAVAEPTAEPTTYYSAASSAAAISFPASSFGAVPTTMKTVIATVTVPFGGSASAIAPSDGYGGDDECSA